MNPVRNNSNSISIAHEKQEEHRRRVLDVLEKRGVEFIENGVRLTRRPRR
jgi:hypothetical protein